MPNPNLDRDQGMGKDVPDRNRDPGADLETEGIPEVADDSRPGTGQAPEPELPVVPAEQPVASTAYGTTLREQRQGEPLETRLAHEEPDDALDRADDTDRPAEEAAMHVVEEP